MVADLRHRPRNARTRRHYVYHEPPLTSSLLAAMPSSYGCSMCLTTQWWLTQTKSKRRPVPGEFFRRPVRWVMASEGPPRFVLEPNRTAIANGS